MNMTEQLTRNIPDKSDYPGSHESWNKIPLGVGANGEISWDITKNAHMLLTSATGGGKSIVQRNIIFHAIQHAKDFNLLGVDLSIVELKPFKKYKETVKDIAVSLEDGVELIRSGYNTMMDRYNKMEQIGVNYFRDLPEHMPALLIMIEEAYMFMAPLGMTDYEVIQEDALHAEASKLLSEIARLGRTAGIHLIIATKRPDPKVIHKDFRDNLTARYASGKVREAESFMVFDSKTGYEVPAEIKGRGVISFNGEEQFIQSYFAAQDWIDVWLKDNNRTASGGFR